MSEQREQELSGATVLLTGVTGFVGSELARQLLQLGAHVRCPIRSSPDSDRIKALGQAFSGLPGSISFVECDLRSEEQLAKAAEGAAYVFHVASPFVITAEDPQRDIVDPAVEGTTAVLKAVAQHKDGVKRVVVTSSVCAIHDCNATQPRANGPNGKYDEADWNTVSTVDKEPYWVSKVEAERAAWRLSEQLGLPLTTILPNFVMGPVAAKEAAAGISVGFFKGFVEAGPAPSGSGATPTPASDAAFRPPPSGTWTFADVRDVARAHVLAAVTHGSAGRRYIVSQGRSTSARTVTDVLKASLPDLLPALPDGEAAEEDEKIDATRVVRELGLSYTPLERTLTDMARSLVDLGLAVPAGAGGEPVAA